MNRFGDIKLGMASQLKRQMASMARATSSCNAFAIATFYSFEVELIPICDIELTTCLWPVLHNSKGLDS